MNRSFKLGLALGLSGKPIQPALSQKDPIGFFYGQLAKEGEVPTYTFNGVDYVGAILPELPQDGKDPRWEWDTERFPYACIHDAGIGEKYRYDFLPFSVKPSYNSAEELMSFPTEAKTRFYTMHDELWENITGRDDPVSAGTIFGMPLPFWANFDIFDENGNKVIEKFKPIPVYE